jgi:hypothetical protein
MVVLPTLPTAEIVQRVQPVRLERRGAKDLKGEVDDTSQMFVTVFPSKEGKQHRN